MHRRRLPAKPVLPHDRSHARKKSAYSGPRQHLHRHRKMTSQHSHKGHQILSQNQHFRNGYPTLPILPAARREGLYPRRTRAVGLPCSTAQTGGGTGPSGGTGEEGMVSPTLGLNRAAGWTPTYQGSSTSGSSPTSPASHGNPTAGGNPAPLASHCSPAAGGEPTTPACEGSIAAWDGPTPPACNESPAAGGEPTTPACKGSIAAWDGPTPPACNNGPAAGGSSTPPVASGPWPTCSPCGGAPAEGDPTVSGGTTAAGYTPAITGSPTRVNVPSC